MNISDKLNMMVRLYDNLDITNNRNIITHYHHNWSQCLLFPF